MSISSKNSVPVILLFGPTAAGKTELLVSLFADDGEVINADSEQVYRGLDIGTAKPDAALRMRPQHHLIDIRDPDEQFTVGDFVRAADEAAAAIAARGKIPIISGGTAYYLKHFAYGLPAAPPSNPAMRTAVRRDLDEKGAGVLYAELERRDPEAAARIHPHDRYRLSRALEVIRQTGRPLSAFRAGDALREEYDFLFIGLALPREELRRRVEQRVEAMFDAGLVEEYQALRRRGYDERAPGMRGIGYRELFLLEAGGFTVPRVKELIVLHTMQYAKRQMTFFKAFPGTVWYHPSEREAIRTAVHVFLRRR